MIGQPFLTAIYAQQFKSTVGIFNPAENTLMVFELERGVVSAFVIGKGRDELRGKPCHLLKSHHDRGVLGKGFKSRSNVNGLRQFFILSIALLLSL